MQRYITEEMKNERLQRSASDDRKAQRSRLRTYGAMVKANFSP